MNPQHNYISSLTSLRAFAALMVVVYHIEALLAKSITNTMFISKGYMMVDLFFVMSGFIMLHVYGTTFSKNVSSAYFKKFINARFARVYPLHLFMLALAVAVHFATKEPPTPVNNPAAIPTNLLLLHSFGIHKIFTWNVPSWSISAEWWSYMVFPFLVLFLATKKQWATIVLALAALLFYIAILYVLPRVNLFVPNMPNPHNLDVTYDYGFLRGLAGFICGLITYNFFNQEKLRAIFKKDVIGFAIIILLIVALHFGINDGLLIPIFMLLVFAIAANQSVLYNIGKLKPLQFLGDISYSIYLVHSAVIFLVGVPILQKMGYVYKGPNSGLQISFLNGLLLTAAILAVVIVVSIITYYFIEKPCRKWINNWGK
jgi:peptidoglycan/LPS O-acetylase OafA/YrhL